ncbi:atpase associated with various cellular activities aaa_5 : Uncharacterized protein OS=Candidatus Entotheonella sp. TSY1 GN=ETSY1_19820 PE=4 SV=1: AAA_5 [Gemmata massiliana]|uniref:AAA+ ATPase domain-containing protein n=1 Tax=Gemmata massiliana TaxID=1210884 RepID=A0A6P2CRJ8_9BACT|nr:MoxR family ATPase [Gemmata massiliana]VTR91708.1 atpase associated with various cellular activities aaa_5 : Uncharacterized protein OS=Candidatus Entotheonella sp. TSY1 GN=ETSY1_19820 PE=4 SV=1: AAA_5 [Gemmata massiliana]
MDTVSGNIMQQVLIPKTGDRLPSVHLFDPESQWAIRAALAANRPLLVRGEPGVGKSQLARAAAVWLKRPFLSVVVDARTESQDLLWSFDAVGRLAQAQICAAFKPADVARELAEERFVHPGKLWWAFDWNGARRQADVVGGPGLSGPEGWEPDDGCVLLIDEIDKAESDVPNGLLEALGSRSFSVRNCKSSVSASGQAPLVVITTNEERILPNAFVRRCLVLHLELPREEKALRELLVIRGEAHLDLLSPPEEYGQQRQRREILEEAAGLLIDARNAAQAKQVRPLPGQAEYLDLIRAVFEITRTDGEDPKNVLALVKGFVLKKTGESPP